MDAEDRALRERLIGLKLRRDELAKDTGHLQRHIASGEPQITPDKIGKVAVLLCVKNCATARVGMATSPPTRRVNRGTDPLNHVANRTRHKSPGLDQCSVGCVPRS